MSDWLTKIILGAGLVGLKDLVTYFEAAVSRAAGGLQGVPFATMIVGADVVGFAVLGFFTIYLLTRLFLVGAFERVEARLARTNERMQSAANMKFGDMSSDEKKYLKKVIDAEGHPTTYKLPPEFRRGSPDHEALRSLRERLLIQPQEGGRWQAGKTVTLTPYGKEIINNLKQAVQ